MCRRQLELLLVAGALWCLVTPAWSQQAAAGPGAAPADPSRAPAGPAPRAARYKLPSWFDFGLYKRLHAKRYGPREDERHRRLYLRTALQVFERRALYRAGRTRALAAINELSDLVSSARAPRPHATHAQPTNPSPVPPARRQTADQLEAFRGRASAARAAGAPDAPELPECCTYDQVYQRIIELLNATQASNPPDWALSRALVDELQVSSRRAHAHRAARPPLTSAPRPRHPQQKPLAGRPARPEEARKPERKRSGEAPSGAPGADGPPLGARPPGSAPRPDEPAAANKRPEPAPGAPVGRPESRTNGPAPDYARHSSGAGGSRTRSPAAPSGAPTSQPALGSAAGGRAPATTAAPHSGAPADGGAQVGVASEFEQSVRQVAEQLSGDSPIGRRLGDQLSAYFGEPVVIRAAPVGLPDGRAAGEPARKLNGTPRPRAPDGRPADDNDEELS